MSHDRSLNYNTDFIDVQFVEADEVCAVMDEQATPSYNFKPMRVKEIMQELKHDQFSAEICRKLNEGGFAFDIDDN